jgi:hypothetical protein
MQPEAADAGIGAPRRYPEIYLHSQVETRTTMAII